MDAPAPATAAAVTAVFAVTKRISYSGLEFTVPDAAGAAVMQVEAEVFLFLKKSLLLDAASRPVLTMQDGNARWEVYMGDSTSRRNLLFNVVKPSPFQIRTKIYVFLASNAREQAPDFVIRGSYYDGACTVSPRNSDTTIAQITYRHTVELLVFGRKIYTARINPGIDQAFILALTVILDGMH